jgi:hypothetical protein
MSSSSGATGAFTATIFAQKSHDVTRIARFDVHGVEAAWTGAPAATSLRRGPRSATILAGLRALFSSMPTLTTTLPARAAPDDDTIYIGARWGLCNRIKAVVSGMRLREELHRQRLIIQWPQDADCGCALDQLFDNPLTVAPWIPRSDLPECWRLWISEGEVPEGFASNYQPWDGRSIDLEYERIPERLQRIYTRHFGALSPVPAIRARVEALAGSLADDVVGVHVRRGDFGSSNRQGQNDGQFFEAMDAVLRDRPAARFVLATDSAETERLFVERYRARIVHHPKTSRVRSQSAAIKDALVDLLLLARCPQLIGTFSSTFSEVAWWMGGCRARVTIIR